jgi:hypothetical protein
MLGARKDSVPEQKPAHGEPPEPGATPGGSASAPRSDAVNGERENQRVEAARGSG